MQRDPMLTGNSLSVSAGNSPAQPGLADVATGAKFNRIARKVANHPKAEMDPNWRDPAACRDTDPELFFPVGATGNALSQIEDARAVCMGCACQDACLEYALRTNQDTGVWGGASEEERRHLRRTHLRRRPAIQQLRPDFTS